MRNLIQSAIIVAFPALAQAAVTVGTLSPQPNPSSGQIFIGQSFTVPVANPALLSISVLTHATVETSATLRIYPFDPSNSNALLSASSLYNESILLPASPSGQIDVFPNLLLTENATYAFILDFGSGNPAGTTFSNFSIYEGGNFIAYAGENVVVFPYDIAFAATFDATPLPEPTSALLLTPALLLLPRPSRARRK